MNVKELIKKIEALPDNIGLIRPHIDKKLVLGLVRQLDEPQKVKIPQFVADVIEDVREDSSELEQAFQSAWWYESDEFTEWYKKKSNRDVFGLAWLGGYEVEKEKRYLVKVKGVYLNSCLVFDKGNKKWFFSSIYEKEHQIGYHTRKELENAGFGEVFNSPLFEVREVEG